MLLYINQKRCWLSYAIVLIAAYFVAFNFNSAITENKIHLQFSNKYFEDKSIYENIKENKAAYYPRSTCIDDAPYESRKKLRWVYSSISRIGFSLIEQSFGYEAMLLFVATYHAALFCLTFFFIEKTVSHYDNLIQRGSFPTLLIISVVFAFFLKKSHWSVYEFYTPMEAACIAATIYYATTKNIFGYILFFFAGVSCRESALSLGVLWIFYNNPRRVTSYAPLVCATIYIAAVNFDVLGCLFEPNFLTPNSLQDESYWKALGSYDWYPPYDWYSFQGFLKNYFPYLFPLFLFRPSKSTIGVYILYIVYALSIFKSTPISVVQPYFLLVPALLVFSFISIGERNWILRDIFSKIIKR